MYLGSGMDIGSALVRMYGDFLFKTPTNNLARALALERGPPIFFYHFTHQVFAILAPWYCHSAKTSITRVLFPYTTAFIFPLSNFCSNSLVFDSGLTGFGPTPPWTGFAGALLYFVKTMFLIIPGPMTECAMPMSCSCCSRRTRCPSPWCAMRPTRG